MFTFVESYTPYGGFWYIQNNQQIPHLVDKAQLLTTFPALLSV